MKETWRWFGPDDPVTLGHVKQAGATGVVSALHHLYRGEAWPVSEVQKRKLQIEAAGLTWSVVESIPVHNSIKLRSGPYREYIDAWKDSLAAISRAGVKVVCYNFMPVIDWTRTDLRWQLPSTGYALRFDFLDLAAYDLFILERKNAEGDYLPAQIVAARNRFEQMSLPRQDALEQNIISGLPGHEASYDREKLRKQLDEYKGISPHDLRANLVSFIRDVAPVAQELGIRLGIHPDDPPISILGLPRVVSTAEDCRVILDAFKSRANGLTFCVGSYGVRADNDLLGMIRKFGEYIHFAHLRQVFREPDGSFHEAEHLNGSSDMVGVIHALLTEEARRRAEGRDDSEIPMRSDHGHLLADDIGKTGYPGYPLIGRLKGLAELRGVIHGLQHAFPELAEQTAVVSAV